MAMKKKVVGEVKTGRAALSTLSSVFLLKGKYRNGLLTFIHTKIKCFLFCCYVFPFSNKQVHTHKVSEKLNYKKLKEPLRNLSPL